MSVTGLILAPMQRRDRRNTAATLRFADEHEMSVQLRSGLKDPRAVLRKAASLLLACYALLTSGDLVSGRSLGCGQKPQLALRPGRSLHLMACSMETP